MKKNTTILVSLFLMALTANSQTKTIEINRLFHQKVPEGKVWVLSNKKTYKAIFSNGVYTSGTACNAAFLSNPNYIYGISYIEPSANSRSRPQTIGFTFKEAPLRLERDVWLIKPHFLLEHHMDSEDLLRSIKWQYQPKEIVFYPGTTVFTSSCLANIVIHERNLNQNDLNYLKVKSKKADDARRLEAIDQNRRLLEERKLKLAKFYDLERAFEPYDISNLNQVRYFVPTADSLSSLLINTITNTVGNSKDSFKQIANMFKSEYAVQLKLNWDSLGNLIKIAGDTTIIKSKVLENNKYFKLASEPLVKAETLSRKCKLSASISCQVAMTTGREYTFWVKQTKKGYKFATPSKFWADDYSSPKEFYKEMKLVEDYLIQKSEDVSDYTKVIITEVKYSIKASSPMFHQPVSKEINGYCFKKVSK